MSAGGFSALQVATPEVQGYCNQIHCGETEYIHIKIYVPLPGSNQPPKLEGCQKHKTKEDPISPF